MPIITHTSHVFTTTKPVLSRDDLHLHEFYSDSEKITFKKILLLSQLRNHVRKGRLEQPGIFEVEMWSKGTTIYTTLCRLN